MSADGFFRRWAKRKAASTSPAAALKQDDVPAATPAPGSSVAQATPPERAPTLEEAARLGTHSANADYARFFVHGTDPAVRRAALKALFTDPHFNAMDGLDVYIGDYTRHAPLTPAMLAGLQHARNILRVDERNDERNDEQQQADDDASAQPVSESPDTSDCAASSQDTGLSADTTLPTSQHPHEPPPQTG